MAGEFLGENSSHEGFPLLVFTDLDGTLLDHETYSFEPALPALNLLQERNIPLVLCTSKTKAEIEPLRNQLKNTHPFISENGGALFIPKGYFCPEPETDRQDNHYLTVEFGTQYSQLREVFKRMQSALPGKLRGFGDCTPDEIAKLCGLSLSAAKLAMQREYDEPFIVEGKIPFDALQERDCHSGLQVTKGGRFYHLMGNNDKGKAVLLLREMYQSDSGHSKAIALGDSLNDLPMLQAVDYPVLVKKHDGSHDPAVKLDNILQTRNSGPSGWNEALLELLPSLGIQC
jgi:mannosyl-3-phosphoglycerate phosphatase